MSETTKYVDKFTIDDDEIIIKDTQAQNDISTLNTNLNGVSNRVTTLENNLNKRKWIFVGDSYNEDNRTSSSGDGWGKRILSAPGITGYSFGLGGAAFGKTGNLSFLYALQSNDSVITNKNEITDIMVCGGYNEWQQTDENIVSGITSFCNYVRQNYINARIHIGFVGRSNLYDRCAEFRRVCMAYKENSRLCGYTYITNSEAIAHTVSLMESDGIHLTSSGLAQLARRLASYALGYGCDSQSNLVTTTPVSLVGGSVYSNCRIYTQITGTIISFILSQFNITGLGGLSIDGTGWTDLLEIPNCAIMPSNNEWYSFNLQALAQRQGATGFTPELFCFKIYRRTSDNKLVLAIRNLNGTSTGYGSVQYNSLYFRYDFEMKTFPVLI